MFGLDLIYVVENEPLGIGGALKLSEDTLDKNELSPDPLAEME